MERRPPGTRVIHKRIVQASEESIDRDNPEKAQDDLLDLAIDVANGERALLYKFDPKGRPLLARARNFDGPLDREHATFSEDVVKIAVADKKIVYLGDLIGDPRLQEAGTAVGPRTSETEALSFIVAPVFEAGRPFAALVVESRTYARALEARDRNAVRKIAVEIKSALLRCAELEARAPRAPVVVVPESPFLAAIIGSSPKMQELRAWIARVASSTAITLILGPTGAGKELVARALHGLSRESKGDLVAFNMAALSETLIDAELFGHEKGAFTGAIEARAGIFELARGGTVFLDEIGEASIAVQAKLLRVLQEKKVRRIGGKKEIEVDCRILAGTNRDLSAMVADGKFREDLLFRLNVLQCRIPPLCERGEDCVEIARSLAEKRGKVLARDAVEAIRGHTWPGNVRELGAAIERGCVETGREIRAQHLAIDRAPPRKKGRTLKERGDDIIREVLEKHGGKVAPTARELGIDEDTIRNRLDLRGKKRKR